MTPEEMKAVEQEIDTFAQKAIDHAANNPELSAHYSRLYRASKLFLAKSAKLALTAKHKEINQKRKAARQGSSATPQSSTRRQTASG